MKQMTARSYANEDGNYLKCRPAILVRRRCGKIQWRVGGGGGKIPQDRVFLSGS